MATGEGFLEEKGLRKGEKEITTRFAMKGTDWTNAEEGLKRVTDITTRGCMHPRGGNGAEILPEGGPRARTGASAAPRRWRAVGRGAPGRAPVVKEAETLEAGWPSGKKDLVALSSGTAFDGLVMVICVWGDHPQRWGVGPTAPGAGERCRTAAGRGPSDRGQGFVW